MWGKRKEKGHLEELDIEMEFRERESYLSIQEYRYSGDEGGLYIVNTEP